MGASLQVSVPLGQYDTDRLVNLGTNRWFFQPELGISKAWGPLTRELAASVTLYTDNRDTKAILAPSPRGATPKTPLEHSSVARWRPLRARGHGSASSM
jgi:hypothetical protein